MRRWAILGLLCLAFIAAYFDRVNLTVALSPKDFTSYFKLSDTDRGLLHSAFFWSYLPAADPGGLAGRSASGPRRRWRWASCCGA